MDTPRRFNEKGRAAFLKKSSKKLFTWPVLVSPARA
jgi:hypothetical protein